MNNVDLTPTQIKIVSKKYYLEKMRSEFLALQKKINNMEHEVKELEKSESEPIPVLPSAPMEVEWPAENENTGLISEIIQQIEAYEEQLNSAPNNPPLLTAVANRYKMLGNARGFASDYGKALDFYTRAIDLEYNQRGCVDSQMLLYRAQALVKINEITGAASDLIGSLNGTWPANTYVTASMAADIKELIEMDVVKAKIQERLHDIDTETLLKSIGEHRYAEKISAELFEKLKALFDSAPKLVFPPPTTFSAGPIPALAKNYLNGMVKRKLSDAASARNPSALGFLKRCQYFLDLRMVDAAADEIYGATEQFLINTRGININNNAMLMFIDTDINNLLQHPPLRAEIKTRLEDGTIYDEIMIADFCERFAKTDSENSAKKGYSYSTYY